MKKQTIFLISIVCYLVNTSFAQQTTWKIDTANSIEMPQIKIISKRNGLFNTLPGSVGVVNQAEMLQTAPISGNEIFKRITGIHVVEEEGAGLRMNLGIRGLDPDRSRSVLVLEDGVPVALNPYGEPELYYTPLIDRMAGVEVLKGSGQLLFGPQTIGGVVNFITKDPPLNTQRRIKLSVGNGGYLSGLLSYGATYGNVGLQVTYLHKQANQLGYTGFNTHDFSTKIKFKLSPKSTLGIKLGYYAEESNSTYIGLTQSMYDAADQDFVLMAPDDKLFIKRSSISATLQTIFSEKLQLNTTMYAYTTARNWQRQDFSSTSSSSNLSGVVWGDTSIVGGAVFMRNQNAHRNRAFEVLGVEPRLKYNYAIYSFNSELQAGARLHIEKAFEQRLNGKKANASSGEMVEDEIRTGKAASAFVQNTLHVNRQIAINAGVRFEHYTYDRNILRNSFSIGGTSLVRDTNIHAGNQLTSLLPGVGINVNISKNNTLFAGLHRGFAPPRVKDAVSNQGEVYALDAEQSWNTEIGTRGHFNHVLEYEITLFSMNFSNQIIPVSESSGGTGTGLVNGGQTLHQGIEIAYLLDMGKILHTKTKLTWKTNMTLNNAVFNQDRFIKVGAEVVNIKGNKTPYAPEYYLTSALNAMLKFGLGAQITAQWVGAQYTDLLNTTLPSADGRIGKLQAYQIFDVNLYYTIPKTKVTFNTAVKNMTNERFITSRRPQGIRVGNPRFLSVGVDVNF